MWLGVGFGACAFSTTHASPHPVKIMAVGDSITEGGAEFACYRPLLAARLAAADRRFEFVGTRVAAWAPALRHEGYGGKNIQFLAVTVPASFTREPADIVRMKADARLVEHIGDVGER